MGVMSISKIAMLTFGMIMLVSSVLISNDAFAVNHLSNNCNLGWIWNSVMNDCVKQVGGLPVPISESEVFGELAQQYSLLLIPAISAIGIATYLVKRKF